MNYSVFNDYIPQGIGYYQLKPMPYGLPNPDINIPGMNGLGCGHSKKPCCSSCAKGMTCEGEKKKHKKKSCCSSCTNGLGCSGGCGLMGASSLGCGGGCGLMGLSPQSIPTAAMTLGVLALVWYGGKHVYENYIADEEEPMLDEISRIRRDMGDF